jgi:hypothetical protein
MTKIKKTEKTKKNTLPPVRVEDETMEKLMAMCDQTKKKISVVIRELIDNGKVEFILNGKELMKDIAGFHNKINQYYLKISNDIQAIQKDIEEISGYMQSEGVESQTVTLYLAKASLRLDDIQQQFNEQNNEWRNSLRLRR